MSPNIHHVFIMATYSVAGHIVFLEKYCGDIWHVNEEMDDKVRKKAEGFLEQIQKLATDLKLEVRSGSLED